VPVSIFLLCTEVADAFFAGCGQDLEEAAAFVEDPTDPLLPPPQASILESGTKTRAEINNIIKSFSIYHRLSYTTLM
jgi:hypothetical protein